MSDAFISYSRKDIDWVRDMVRSLEAEGFSVHWDRNVPPGKTWDDVLARELQSAKACIVVWSANSVNSDWVKEEATIAKDSGKYLPVQIGPELPPLGFRRIQAADLTHWRINAACPQWRLLIAATAHLVRGAAQPEPAPPLPPPEGRDISGRRQPLKAVPDRHNFPTLIAVGFALSAAAIIYWTVDLKRPPAAPSPLMRSAAPANKLTLTIDRDPPNVAVTVDGTDARRA